MLMFSVKKGNVLIHGGMILLLFFLSKSGRGESFQAGSLYYFIFHVLLFCRIDKYLLLLSSLQNLSFAQK